MNLISQVQAQEVSAVNGQNAEGFSFSSFVPLLLIFVIFYILLIRPQNKKMKEHQALVNNIKKGDKVITSSGIIGVISDINNKEGIVDLHIADDVVIQIVKHNVLEVVKSKSNKKNKKDKKK